MLLFAHLGITLAAARYVGKSDIALLALGSMLPDIIDKPLGLIAFGTPNMGRIFCHTLLFFLILVALAVLSKKMWLYSLAGGTFAHLVLDFMWNSPVTLFWPILGSFPQVVYLDTITYLQILLLGLREPLVFVREFLGLAYILFFAWEMKIPAKTSCINGAKTLWQIVLDIL